MATTILINVVVGLATVGVFAWIDSEQIGLINYMDLHWGVELLICILIMDLIGQYTVHVYLHKWKWMWRLHMNSPQRHTHRGIDRFAPSPFRFYCP